uniref:NADH dehydrogenase subunit 6 n=1 Tax=Odontothrips phaseoli TaxID=3078581 RepID=UPI002A83D8F3|nr:NADH dehydrogenase subunit 6 [Odontothrips phaseoli]WOH21576.1 NADH dehydrogenase subunit 6 [Odontothrips phaseoli]
MNSIFLVKMIIWVMLSLTFIFIVNSSHPIILGFLVILQSILISLMISMMFSISWFSFLVFMIYLGGILMLFCYMISLMNSKEPFFFKNKMVFLPSMLIFWGNKQESFLKMSKMEMKTLLISIYSKSMMTSTFMMILLLLIMVFVIMISESSKGSMRSM